MTTEMMEQIKKTLQEQIPNINPTDLVKIQERKFDHDGVVTLAQKYGKSELQAEALADSIDRIKEPTARVNPLAFNADGAESNERKPWTPWNDTVWLRRACGLSLVALIIVVIASAASCSSCNGSKKNEDAVTRIDAAVSNLQALVDGMKADMSKKADLDDVKTAVSNVDKKVDGVGAKVDRLVASVDALTKSTTTLITTTNTLVENTAKLATTKHLRRVERKLDAHIAGEEQAKEATPEPTPVAGNGTIHVVVRRVPVDDEE